MSGTFIWFNVVILLGRGFSCEGGAWGQEGGAPNLARHGMVLSGGQGPIGPSVWTSGTESPFSSGDKEGPASFALRPTAEHVHWGYGGLTQTKKQGQVIIT